MYLSMNPNSIAYLTRNVDLFSSFFDLRVNASRFNFATMTDKMNLTYAYKKQNRN